MFKHAVIVCLTTSLFASASAWADEDIDADAYIKYRENLMDSAKAHSKGISAILKGKVAAKDHLARHARSLNEIAAMLADAFPEGSDFGETRAKESIWEDDATFRKQLEKFHQASAALVETTAQTNDPAKVGKAMKDVSASCKSCHKKFRSKE